MRKPQRLPHGVDSRVSERLRQWAVWLMRRLDAGPAGYGMSSLANLVRVDCNGRMGSYSPMGDDPGYDVHEVRATHEFVMRLDHELQVIVAAFWLGGRPISRIAREIGLERKVMGERFARINGQACAALFPDHFHKVLA